MITAGARRLRADAARNTEKIVLAAREVYRESGPDATLDDIARHAGVGIATLYRRFPNKEEIVRAALEQGIAEEVSPTIDRALGDDDPKHGLMTLIEATLSLVAREHNMLAAANNSGALTAEVTAPILDALGELTRRGQQAGCIRADLVFDDLQRVMGMLAAVLPSMDTEGHGWRRYVTLILDGLSPIEASPLPPAAPMRQALRTGCSD